MYSYCAKLSDFPVRPDGISQISAAPLVFGFAISPRSTARTSQRQLLYVPGGWHGWTRGLYGASAVLGFFEAPRFHFPCSAEATHTCAGCGAGVGRGAISHQSKHKTARLPTGIRAVCSFFYSVSSCICISVRTSSESSVSSSSSSKSPLGTPSACMASLTQAGRSDETFMELNT